jgi:hypothetical protein
MEACKIGVIQKKTGQHWFNQSSYTFIFLGIDEYMVIYSSALYCSVSSSVN